MSLDYRPQTVTAETYDRIFALEQAQAYPSVDQFELSKIRHPLDRGSLEAAARVLECPFKAAPPNWQHGRVLYAVASDYLSRCSPGPFTLLDIGTAKGFSALCLLWALDDAGLDGTVYSVDVQDPLARIRRNTIAEADHLRTLPEILEPWPEAQRIHFEHTTSLKWLASHPERIHVAFVDGKHEYQTVLKEGKLLADRQQAGDVVVFDDIQMPGVGKAVRQLDPYVCEYLSLGTVNRTYAIGVRR